MSMNSSNTTEQYIIVGNTFSGVTKPGPGPGHQF